VGIVIRRFVVFFGLDFSDFVSAKKSMAALCEEE
tara:strand:- start:43 stop:144 length:102 start_codon:yes stop_codon:yes gene_type:complete